MFYHPPLLKQLHASLADHIVCWEVGGFQHISLLKVSENVTFLVTNRVGKRFIFRYYRPKYHTDAEILSELQWMQALSQAGIEIRIPELYLTKQGQPFLSIEIDQHCWRIACFEYIAGASLSEEHRFVEWFEKIGVISALFHCHSRGWHRPKWFCRKEWTYETMIGKQAYWGDWRQLLDLSYQELQIVSQCSQQIKENMSLLSRHDPDYSLLHSDLRFANLLSLEEKLAVLDFDDCGFSWTALDFANAVSFMEDHPLLPLFYEKWLKGYQTILEPSQRLQNFVNDFIMMRRIQLTAWMATHSETDIVQKMSNDFVAKTVQLAEQFLDKKPFVGSIL